MEQEEIAKIFRKQELDRRAVRAAVIINHIKLTEDMTPEERESYRLALIADNRSYWKRLWDSLLGRK